jgi:transcriptional regulator with XRE-family HTH domain
MATAETPRHAGGRPRQLKRCPMGQQIERWAAKRGLHLDQVASRSGISFPTLNRILTGRIKNPKLDTVLSLASTLRIKVEQLTS